MVDPDVAGPAFDPIVLLDVLVRSIVASGLVPHSDSASEDANIGFAGKPRNEHHGTVPDDFRPFALGVAENSMAASTLDRFYYRQRQRDAIAFVADKLHESLWGVGEDRRHLDVLGIDNTDIGAEVAKLNRSPGASPRRKMVRNLPVPLVDLGAPEVAAAAAPQIVEIGTAGSHTRLVIDHYAELVIAPEPRLGEIGRGDDCPRIAEHVQLGVKVTYATNGGAGLEQLPQGGDVTRAIGKVRKVVPGNDSDSCRFQREELIKCWRLDEWAGDPEFASIQAQAIDQLRCPTRIDQTVRHGFHSTLCARHP